MKCYHSVQWDHIGPKIPRHSPLMGTAWAHKHERINMKESAQSLGEDNAANKQMEGLRTKQEELSESAFAFAVSQK